MAKLNPNAQKWVDALRSGKYTQVKGRLKWGAKRCCLGVACDVAGPDLKLTWKGKTFDGSENVLPFSVQDWLGVDEENPALNGTTLAKLNDEGMPFEEIADLIEEHAIGLGVSA